MILGIPTPSPTPIAILSLESRPEEPVLSPLSEEPPPEYPLPVVGEEVSSMDEEVEVVEIVVA